MKNAPFFFISQTVADTGRQFMTIAQVPPEQSPTASVRPLWLPTLPVSTVQPPTAPDTGVIHNTVIQFENNTVISDECTIVLNNMCPLPYDSRTTDYSRGEEWSVCGGPCPVGSVGCAGDVVGGLVGGHNTAPVSCVVAGD